MELGRSGGCLLSQAADQVKPQVKDIIHGSPVHTWLAPLAPDGQRGGHFCVPDVRLLFAHLTGDWESRTRFAAWTWWS